MDDSLSGDAGTGTVVAVIGLGAMGMPMAQRLGEAFPIVAFDLTQERLEEAREAGIGTRDSARAAVEGADAVLLMVRTPDQLLAAIDETDGFGASLKPGSVVIVCSTVGISAIEEAAEQLDRRGVYLVDAPVSGGPRRAGLGDLLIVVGATDVAYRAAQPALNQLASRLTVVGDRAGAGQAFKTVNQLLCGVHIAAAGEALALAERFGLDRSLAIETLQAGAAASFMLGDRGPRMLEAYEPEGAATASRLDIFVKDLGLVLDAAKDESLATPVAAAAHQLFLAGLAQGLAVEDDSSVITVLAPREPKP